jgi:hypothetical protein
MTVTAELSNCRRTAPPFRPRLVEDEVKGLIGGVASLASLAKGLSSVIEKVRVLF